VIDPSVRFFLSLITDWQFLSGISRLSGCRIIIKRIIARFYPNKKVIDVE
jgi:hypothetical protein